MMANSKINAFLVHLGFNMWLDQPEKDGIHALPGKGPYQYASDTLRFDSGVWHDLSWLLKEAGCNMILIDVAEGMKYETHPEIAVKGAWSKTQLADELSRLRSMGFEVIPKLNFSAGHDEWMGIYSRMLSTPAYYKFCEDVIDEVYEVFGNPRFFHLGMDEECVSIQENLYELMIVRQGELFWHDFNHIVRKVEQKGARPWIWADHVWHNGRSRDSFLAHVSKDILLSNWYYGRFEEKDPNNYLYRAYTAYELLEKHGYDQIPAASNCSCRENYRLTMEYVRKVVSDRHLLGIEMTTWMPTIPEKREALEDAVCIMKEAGTL